MSRNTKTPAMLLQELAVKRKYPAPEYVLTLSKSGTHEPEFRYKVIVGEISAPGYGHSKQVAKHDAASNALQILAQEGLYDLETNPIKFNAASHRNESDSPMKSPVNHVGALNDMCLEHKLPFLEFVEISDVGPPHCREFTYECRVGSVRSQATANTKKQAKQLAAKSMIDKVKDIWPALAQQYDDSVKSITASDEEVIQKFLELSTFNDIIPDKSMKVEEQSYFLRKILEENNLSYDDFREDFQDKSRDGLSRILDKLNLQYIIQSTQQQPVIAFFVLKVDPHFSTIGLDVNGDKAVEKCIWKALFFLEWFMKP